MISTRSELSLTCLISCCFEEVLALLKVEEVADVLEGVADGIEG